MQTNRDTKIQNREGISWRMVDVRYAKMAVVLQSLGRTLVSYRVQYTYLVLSIYYDLFTNNHLWLIYLTSDLLIIPIGE